MALGAKATPPPKPWGQLSGLHSWAWDYGGTGDGGSLESFPVELHAGGGRFQSEPDALGLAQIVI